MLAQPSNYCYKPWVPRSRPIGLWRSLPCPATLSQKSLPLFSKDSQSPAGLGAPCLPFLPGLHSDRFLDRPLQHANHWWVCPLPLTPLCPREGVTSAETPRLTRAWALQSCKAARAAAVSWTSLKEATGRRRDHTPQILTGRRLDFILRAAA